MEKMSVPPLVASALKHRLMAKPLMMPPKMVSSSTLSVKYTPGITSTSTLASTTFTHVRIVNFLPTKRMPITVGAMFSITLISVYGIAMCRYFSKID